MLEMNRKSVSKKWKQNGSLSDLWSKEIK